MKRPIRRGSGFCTRLQSVHEELERTARKHGQRLPFRVSELTMHFLGRGECARCDYCGMLVGDEEFTFCARNPLERGGKLQLANLALTCISCRQAKGILDHIEFRELWRTMSGWPKPIVRDVLTRLRRGPTAVDLPDPGSLEWFTCSQRAVGE